jgi:fused signal recognition particle receptor
MTERGASEPAAASGWLVRLRRGLAKSSTRLSDGIAGIFTKRKLDAPELEALEELLIAADLGPAVAARLVDALKRRRFEKEVSPDAIRGALAEEIAAILAPVARGFAPDPAKKPHVVLVVGVNGSGKTTTIGKLAALFRAEGRSVWLAAGDTFRAAAIEQLAIWGERTGATVVAGQAGADPAGLAFEALEKAKAAGADVLLVDTAGRLHNKANLMAELGKIARVLKKLDPAAPEDCLLVLDATTGQNALAQVETFRQIVPLTGLIVTKLDGTARGGIVVALAERFGLPVFAVGVGESAEDLRPFSADGFARSLVGE